MGLEDALPRDLLNILSQKKTEEHFFRPTFVWGDFLMFEKERKGKMGLTFLDPRLGGFSYAALSIKLA